MPFRIPLVLVLVVSNSLLNCVEAQTLTEKLQHESAEQLVVEARESGNIVRGAILFHQGNINCSKCHQPAADKDRLAPDLSRLGKMVTDASLVESILDPSKTISKGYETLKVLTVDGRVVSGLVVSQNEKMIVLRDSRDVDKLHQIPSVDIDETVPGKVSVMPSGLVDELTGRQQFLDLLRYVIDVKERGPTETVALPRSMPVRELTSALKGFVLIRERNCVACHDSSVIDSLPASNQGPNLKWSATHLDSRYLTPVHCRSASHQTRNQHALAHGADGSSGTIRGCRSHRSLPVIHLGRTSPRRSQRGGSRFD